MATDILSQIKEAGFESQREFAAYVGMTEEHVSRLVRGKRKPSPLMLRYLATAVILRRAALSHITNAEGGPERSRPGEAG